MIILIFLLIGQGDLFEPHNIQAFADYLYDREDYTAALGEYRRYQFLTDSVETHIHERIVDCLTRLERYEEAIVAADNFADANKRNFTKGLVYFTSGAVDSSRKYLESVDIPYDGDARRLIGLGYAYEFNFDKAAAYIPLPENPPSYKQPALGALFSIVPGGGHFYTGRFGDGIYSFLVVGTAALLSYYYYDRDEKVKFGFSLGAAILFYAGNIYGGVNSVRNYNYYENERYLQQIILRE
jgi:hypothetical protein